MGLLSIILMIFLYLVAIYYYILAKRTCDTNEKIDYFAVVMISLMTLIMLIKL